MAELLRDAAAAACARAERVMEEAVRRRSARAKLTPEAMERIEDATPRLEVLRSSREMRHAELETARRMRAEAREAAGLERSIRAGRLHAGGGLDARGARRDRHRRAPRGAGTPEGEAAR